MKRALITSVLIASSAAILLVPASASASGVEVHGFSNNTQITIPTKGKATPYPSTINVSGVTGPVTEVQVGLFGVTHARPQDLDLLLVPPDGSDVILMSDACGNTPLTNATLQFTSSGNPPPVDSSCSGTAFYDATNLDGEADAWPGAPGEAGYPLSSWNRKAMNGDWKLYVVDDRDGNAGKIARGWALQFTTGPVETFIPSYGQAAPYPTTNRVIGGDHQVLTDLNVTVKGLAHDRPRDMRLLLVSPLGQSVVLMSSACGSARLEQSITFDDQAPKSLPMDAGPGECPTTAQPTNYGPNIALPPPAPQGSYNTQLSTFNGTPAAGDWKLYAFDGQFGADGYIAQGFGLQAETRPAATVEFSDNATGVAEGGTNGVLIKRTGPDPLGPATVNVSTVPGSATAGADFSTISGTVQFAAGEREKSVVLSAVDDGVTEPDESFSVELSSPTGDAQLGPQSQVDVVIPGTASGPDPQPHPDPDPHPVPPPPPATLCDGKAATIVGTAGRDVLRGTPRPDVIAGLGGNDKITAVNGNDTVCGGAGSDTIAGGAGRDRLLGGPGNDRLTGGAGRDTCLGGRGRNRVTCERKTGA